MRGLTGRRILIAGGGGIGGATATRLAQEGAHVVIGDLDQTAADSMAQQIIAHGGTASAVGYDQSDESSIIALVADTAEKLGGLDGVHANAADLSPATMKGDRNVSAMDTEIWDRVLRVNLTGCAVLIREALPHLLAQQKGSIVCTTSAASELGNGSQPAYAASKAGINSLVRHVAKRWGPAGIRANAVSPGMVLTEVGKATQTKESLALMQSSTPSFRLGEPEDIAAAVVFLLSDDGEWVNGQIWSINGGLITRG
jgi:NAD(P)-dependent dehydrogenase (short-subunit alcohol dehydrogenase family)